MSLKDAYYNELKKAEDELSQNIEINRREWQQQVNTAADALCHEISKYSKWEKKEGGVTGKILSKRVKKPLLYRQLSFSLFLIEDKYHQPVKWETNSFDGKDHSLTADQDAIKVIQSYVESYIRQEGILVDGSWPHLDSFTDKLKPWKHQKGGNGITMICYMD